MRILKEKLAQFRAARTIAFTQPKGYYRRAGVTNFVGIHTADNRFFVIGDNASDIQNPDATILGRPAREVFEDFNIIYK